MLLLRLVGVAGVHMLQIDHLALDVEPDAGVALVGRLVVPPVMSGTVAGHQTQLATQPVVGGCFELGVRVRKSQASASRSLIVAARSVQTFRDWTDANRISSSFFVGRSTLDSFAMR